jgi:phage/plasmid primase-like uncharacterized protein
MGWGRWFFLGDMGQQLDLQDQAQQIEQLRQNLAAQAQASAERTSDDLRRLREENNELKLYLAATLRLLMGKGVATREEIQALVRAIDAEDGSVDRKAPGHILGSDSEELPPIQLE